MSLRFEFEDGDGGHHPATRAIEPPEPELAATVPMKSHSRDSRGDLVMVEELLDRCWREVDSTALNVKLADIVRLLEFKNKLRSAADAEKTFWSMINEMRRDELNRFGMPNAEAEASTSPVEDHL